jgi:hypothetical protein
MEHYLAALRSYHVDRMLPTDVFESPTVRRMIKGSKNLFGRSKTPRLPITIDILTKLTASQPSSKLDYNLRACYLVAFAAFLRMGEVTYDEKDLKNKTAFFETKVTRSCIHFSPNYDHATLLLKRSKTDVNNEGVTILIGATNTPLCPVQALRDLFLYDPQDRSEPLFNFNRRAFTKARVRSSLHHSLQALGINTEFYKLHSFRIGAAQHAADSGLRHDQIQTLGRWSSQAFKVYFTTSPATLYSYSVQFQTGKPLSFGNRFDQLPPYHA